MKNNSVNPSTIMELAQWMEDNCYRKDSYAIHGQPIFEGLGISIHNGKYVWYHTERGIVNYLNYFDTEREVVQYAFKEILQDEHAKRHLIRLTNNEQEIKDLLDELKKKGIEYYTDKIPYDSSIVFHTRVFVVGCDIKKVGHLNKIKQ